jgi:membrane-bound lytic murein transglycosylase D
MFKRKKIVFKLFLFFITTSLSGNNYISDKYPTYNYVLSQFGVDSNYIYNNSFKKFVIEKEKSLARFYKNSLKRGKDYIPTFKYMLRDDGLSDLFIYMSMVESGFNPNAISSKKAVGIWQFMPSTARHYNLSVNKYIDERYNPISSTTAAIKYLKKLKKDFGKWYLAIMAYNCGEGRVAKAIKKAGSDDIVVLLDKNQKYIPKETRDYVKKILLLSMIGENNPNNLDIPLAFKSKENTIINYDDEGTAEVFVKRGTNLSILAQIIGVDKNILSRMNTHIQNQDSLVEEITNITIPKDKLAQFYLLYDIDNSQEDLLDFFQSSSEVMALASLKAGAKAPVPSFERTISEIESKDEYFLSYVVENNISIYKLANEYNITMADICKANRFLKTNLEVGEIILIPTTEENFNSLVK